MKNAMFQKRRLSLLFVGNYTTCPCLDSVPAIKRKTMKAPRVSAAIRPGMRELIESHRYSFIQRVFKIDSCLKTEPPFFVTNQ